MRGGLERWKRGKDSQGVRAAIGYALDGNCDAAVRLSSGVEALAAYSNAGERTLTRFTVEAGQVTTDELTRGQLCDWVDGRDPLSGERRGRELASPRSDLLLDGTINASKSYSLVSLMHLELAAEFEALQDRLRDRVITTWQRELNARRGAGGKFREGIRRLEVVELQHRRSRALDPHIHRHLWLSVKVQGEDGKWSNVDSRVAMKLHTVINAEGELAARTDPEWIAALARHGYTLDGEGEIAELAHVVRPLSRRSSQIEANRAVFLAEWRTTHPGQEPDRDVLARIDRRSWAKGRPRKPYDLSEASWEQMIREELDELDPALRRLRDAVTIDPIAESDVSLLAAVAIADADRRSSAYGGRFSAYDLRAGAMRAVAASGVVDERDALQPFIDDVIRVALAQTMDLLDGEQDRPEHIKGFMATSTATLKHELAALFDRLGVTDGRDIERGQVESLAGRVLDGMQLDLGQIDAAAAIAGTHRLVAVAGPAGTGKTTMLRVAKRALDLQRRRLIVVAPTKKAASVAGREVGAAASSLHALLADHGWRWTRSEAGEQRWAQLKVGDVDSVGIPYRGPRRYAVGVGDRILVDEAGMVDLQTARALALLAVQTGAGIAMVGDHLQAMPVGHSGAMACMARRSGTFVELTAVHRFHDAEYAALTLRLREPASRTDAIAVATELEQRGHIHEVTDHAQARDVMVEAYFRAAAAHRRVALVAGTNDEADAINDAIQQRRLEQEQLSLRRIAVGLGEQRLLEGDIVQTRRNDTVAGVENRALWTVRRIHEDRIDLVSVHDSGDFRTVTADYAAEHVQLAYASTVHGIQGETTDSAIVGPGVDAAGLYVGMTRGRRHNEAIALVRPNETAVEVIADAMARGLPEVTIDDSRRAALVDLDRAARTVPGGRVAEDLEHYDALAAWLRDSDRLLREIYARHADAAARAHGRGAILESAPTDPRVAQLRSLLAIREPALVRLHEELIGGTPEPDPRDAEPAASPRTPSRGLGL